jgi:RNA polymerase sigma-70 factor (ECF subfamily)
MNKSNGMEDNQLVRECLQGETEEFKKIVEKYTGKTMALALNILGNKEDAEDVCQETFLQTYRNLSRFDTQKSFSNWLLSILYKRCLDQLRKRRRFLAFYKRAKGEAEEITRSPSLGSITQNPHLHSLLERLSPKERTTLYLWAGEGYTSVEIAEVLRCAPNTARIHLHKARKKIKSLLEKENV